MQLFRRADFVIKFPISFNAHLPILNKTTAKQPSFIYQVSNSVSIIYGEMDTTQVDTTQACQIVCK